MKLPVFDMEGKEARQIELPSVFSEQVRPDLINRAAMAVRSTRFQPKGSTPLAGLQTSAEYVGRRRAYRTMINIERARLPKVKLAKGRFGEVRIVPQSRGGRPAHPPKVEKILVERINKKERRKAIRSALAATANPDLVQKRGHRVAMETPIIVEDSFEKLKKTKEVLSLFEKLKLEKELERDRVVKIRVGRGKMRGRRYKRRKGVLVVVSKSCPAVKASENIPGVDVSVVKNLNADLLAPGGQPGRLALFTESAIKELDKLFR
jgi:large subunit ribosomal protein L4e